MVTEQKHHRKTLNYYSKKMVTTYNNIFKNHIFYILNPYRSYNRACYLKPDLSMYIILKIGNYTILQYNIITLIRDKRDYILFPFQIQNKLFVDRVLHG